MPPLLILPKTLDSSDGKKFEARTRCVLVARASAVFCHHIWSCRIFVVPTLTDLPLSPPLPCACFVSFSCIPRIAVFESKRHYCDNVVDPVGELNRSWWMFLFWLPFFFSSRRGPTTANHTGPTRTSSLSSWWVWESYTSCWWDIAKGRQRRDWNYVCSKYCHFLPVLRLECDNQSNQSNQSDQSVFLLRVLTSWCARLYSSCYCNRCLFFFFMPLMRACDFNMFFSFILFLSCHFL